MNYCSPVIGGQENNPFFKPLTTRPGIFGVLYVLRSRVRSDETVYQYYIILVHIDFIDQLQICIRDALLKPSGVCRHKAAEAAPPPHR